MKKIAFVLALATLLAAFAGCTSAPSSSAPASGSASVSAPASEPASEPASDAASGSGEAAEAGSLEAVMDQVLSAADADQLPMLLPADANGGNKYTPITEENAEYNLGVTRDRFADGIAADAAMSSVAFSVCLVKANSAEEAEQLAADIEANADTRKWICVEAEKKVVEHSGDLVLLVMASSDLADQLAAGFTAAMAQ